MKLYPHQIAPIYHAFCKAWLEQHGRFIFTEWRRESLDVRRSQVVIVKFCIEETPSRVELERAMKGAELIPSDMMGSFVIDYTQKTLDFISMISKPGGPWQR